MFITWRGRGKPRPYVYRADKPVTATRNSLHIARLVRRIPQRQAQLLDGSVDAVVELDNRVIRPQLLANLLPRHQLAGRFQQHFQNLEGLFLKANLAVVLVQFSGFEVQLEGSEADRVTIHGVHRITHSPCRGSVSPG